MRRNYITLIILIMLLIRAVGQPYKFSVGAFESFFRPVIWPLVRAPAKLAELPNGARVMDRKLGATISVLQAVWSSALKGEAKWVRTDMYIAARICAPHIHFQWFMLPAVPLAASLPTKLADFFCEMHRRVL